MINIEEKVIINNDLQNIRIISEDTTNPVILFIHGGPGVCDRHLIIKYHFSLSKYYTMVCWDQRGSGKSYNKKIKKQNLDLDDYINDAKALIEYLCNRFNKEKIIVAGHSWGTIIGLPLVYKYPDNILAYIAQGQFISGKENEEISYKFCLDEAKKRNHLKKYQELSKYPPVDGEYPNQKAMLLQRDLLNRYGGGNYKNPQGIFKSLIVPVLTSKEYGLFNLFKYASGALYLSNNMWSKIVKNDYRNIDELKIPVLITQGVHDYNTPSSLVKAWYDNLKAPSKKIVWFSSSAHSPIIEEKEEWEKAIIEFRNEL